MICELCNKIIKFINEDVFKGHVNCCETEVSLTNAIFIIMYGTIVTLIIAWWLIPLRKILEHMDNVKFKCDKNKIKE